MGMAQNPFALIFRFALGLVALIVLAVVAFYAFIFIIVIGVCLFAFVKIRAFLREKGILSQPANPFENGAEQPRNSHSDLADGPTIDGDFEVVDEDK